MFEVYACVFLHFTAFIIIQGYVHSFFNNLFSLTFLQPQNQQQTVCKHPMQPLSHQPQFHPIHQSHHQPMQQSPQASHFAHNHQCVPPSHLTEISHCHQPTISQQMACLQPLTGGHAGGRLHVLVRIIKLTCFSSNINN